MNRREFSKVLAGSASLLLPRTGFAASPARIEPATHPTPALRQFEKLQFGVSFHFSMNTFTGNDYETGGVPASTYNPTNLDVRQWIRVARDWQSGLTLYEDAPDNKLPPLFLATGARASQATIALTPGYDWPTTETALAPSE